MTSDQTTGARNAGDNPDSGNTQPESAELTITVVARMFRIPVLTLRRYEMYGLIRRQKIGGLKVFSWTDCERIALLVKAKRAGIRPRALRRVIAAMHEGSSVSNAETGRSECVALIRTLETNQQAIGNALGELYRIDWELSKRLGLRSAHESGAKLKSFRCA